MHYLCNMYDLNGKLGGRTVEEKAIIDQWLCLQLSGLGPVQGNVNWYAFLLCSEVFIADPSL